MTKEDINKQLDDSAEKQVKDFLRLVRNTEKDKDSIHKLHALLKAAQVGEFDPITGQCFSLNPAYVYLRGCKNFDFMKNLLEAGELLDLPLEKWKTNDYPERKNRDFLFTLPSGATFFICVYLSDDAECRLVEVSRTMEERVEYRLECGEADEPQK